MSEIPFESIKLSLWVGFLFKQQQQRKMLNRAGSLDALQFPVLSRYIYA